MLVLVVAVEECAESASYIDQDHDQEHAHDILYPDLMSNYFMRSNRELVYPLGSSNDLVI